MFLVYVVKYRRTVQGGRQYQYSYEYVDHRLLDSRPDDDRMTCPDLGFILALSARLYPLIWAAALEWGLRLPGPPHLGSSQDSVRDCDDAFIP